MSASIESAGQALPKNLAPLPEIIGSQSPFPFVLVLQAPTARLGDLTVWWYLGTVLSYLNMSVTSCHGFITGVARELMFFLL
jgi:hypothetical protein